MIISLINVIYNLIESVQSVFITKVFLGSIYIFFIPYNRYINNDNVFELLILFLLFVISFMVLFFSAKELLNNKNIKYPFTIANILWFDFILIIPLLIVSSHDKDFLEYFSCSNFIYGYLSIFIMILQIIVMIMKSFNYYRMVKNNSILAKEEFLFETFSWHAKSYKQIKRTALGIPVITILTFFFSLLLEYINTEKSIILIDFLYIMVTFLSVFILISVNIEYNHYKKNYKEKIPYTDFLKYLNVIQIISIVCFIVSYFIILFIR